MNWNVPHLQVINMFYVQYNWEFLHTAGSVTGAYAAQVELCLVLVSLPTTAYCYQRKLMGDLIPYVKVISWMFLTLISVCTGPK
jgi:hypothetical protein